ncbi:MAG: SDR family oxidoreductase, partial [Candidatus Omnitrophica bacterium]|nr:SDR family oxidoreductase [Candidatus Omnitrophota bacterium]
MTNHKGKCAIVTGASRGIGKAIATRLAESGINLVLAARTKATLDQAVEELKQKTGVRVIGVATDVGKLEDLKNLVEVATKEFKNIDILVNSAGVSSQYPFEKQPMEDLEMLAQTNYL